MHERRSVFEKLRHSSSFEEDRWLAIVVAERLSPELQNATTPSFCGASSSAFLRAISADLQASGGSAFRRLPFPANSSERDRRSRMPYEFSNDGNEFANRASNLV
jgi:hypothetical protein